jgi:branched-chain amino acid transport system permease protein
MSAPAPAPALSPPASAPSSARRLDVDVLRTAVSTGRGRLYWPRHATLLLFAAGVLLVGGTGSASTRYGLVLSTVYAIAILGNNGMAGTLREINLSAGAFIAVGAYTASWCLEHGTGILLASVLSVLAATVTGAVLAVPTSRLRGIQTALVTFALAYSIGDLATYLKGFTGGDNGKFFPSDIGVGGLVFAGSEFGMLLLVVVVMVVAGVLHLRFLNGRVGRLAITVGEAEQAASVFGVPVRRLKIAVWAWGAALAGVAGVLYGLSVGYLGAQQWPITLSLFIFVGGLIGGSRSVTGAWIGGIIVAGLPLWLQNFIPPNSTTIAFGLILLLTLLAGGKGLSEFAERGALYTFLRLRRTS